MRNNIIKEIQKELNILEVNIIFSKNYIRYIINLEDVYCLFISKRDYIIFGNISDDDFNNIKGCSRNDLFKNINNELFKLRITDIYCDFKHLPTDIYLNLKKDYIIKNKLDSEKLLIGDRDFVKINKTICFDCIDRVISEINMSNFRVYNAILNFKKNSNYYNIDDVFLSISSNSNCLNLNDKFNYDDIYMFDFGLCYQGIYTDFTICKKFSKYTIDEKIHLKNLIDINKYIRTSIMNLSPMEIHEHLSNNYNISLGLGHSIGFTRHGNYSLNFKEDKKLSKNTFFTIEPILKYNNNNFNLRIESIYDNFDNEIYGYIDIENLIW